MIASDVETKVLDTVVLYNITLLTFTVKGIKQTDTYTHTHIHTHTHTHTHTHAQLSSPLQSTVL